MMLTVPSFINALFSLGMTTEITINSEAESVEFANKIAAQINKGTIITFSGDLGSGKTFLCRAIIKYLCGDYTNVISPTFNLLQIYTADSARFKFNIYHFDLYRLNQPYEVYELGIEEAFLEEAVCLIEWPEIISNILPNTNRISIEISIIDATSRRIRIKQSF